MAAIVQAPIAIGYNDSPYDAYELEEKCVQTIYADSTGKIKNTAVNCFYVFIPTLSTRQSQFEVPIDKVDNQNTIILEKSKYIEYDSSYMFGFKVGVTVYKVSIITNTETVAKNAKVLVKGTIPDIAKLPDYDITINIEQAASSSTDTDKPTNPEYEWAKGQSSELEPFYEPIYDLPKVISGKYPWQATSEWDSSVFSYIYIHRKRDSLLSYYSDASWANFEFVEDSKYADNTNKTIVQVVLEENPTSTLRSTKLYIKRNDTSVLELTVIQRGQGESSKGPFDDAVVTNNNVDVEEEKRKYWNSENVFSVIDNNEGAVIDATSLLYKSNEANIYSTLEQKDNTLFLGNYINNNTINDIHAKMNAAIAEDEDVIQLAEGIRKIYIDTSSSTYYKYVPNLLQNSQQKHLFKKGEEYILGLVFVNKAGNWSTVYPLRNIYNHNDDLFSNVWVPSTEPCLYNEVNEENNEEKYYYHKPVEICWLSKELVHELSVNGIIGIIPVYAAKNNHKVLCQGYLSPTLSTEKRKTNEGVEAQYSWFYRSDFTKEELLSGVADIAEIQSHAFSNPTSSEEYTWKFNYKVCTLNTPETEISETLTESMLASCKCRRTHTYPDFTCYNNIILQTEGTYLHSKFESSKITSITKRLINGCFWYGLVDRGYTSSELLEASNDKKNYANFYMYPWQRNKMGGEGASSRIITKKWFNYLYNVGVDPGGLFEIYAQPNVDNNTILDTSVYRDFDTASLLRLDSLGIYQGNVDYIEQVTSGYKVKTDKMWSELGDPEHIRKPEYEASTNIAYPYYSQDADNKPVFAGYDKDGFIKDPISIKYKTAPHVVINFETEVNLGYKRWNANPDLLHVVELYSPNIETKIDVQSLAGYQWLKCGDMKRIYDGEDTAVFFEEGDYFFGRFDSLRTYPFTNEDVNSVTEVVSGMLCSRVNLDARVDRNRGATMPVITPINFNIFNSVYDQQNNFFTFVYEDVANIVHNRAYSNSIQWSMTKNYSSDVDEWCNIQNANTMDLDGDKGEIQALCKLGNNLIAFQDTGIARIQYNEKTQIVTTEGVPIEIANTGKVDGKYYLYDNIGCQDKKTIAKSPSGIYFIDNINKSIYLLGVNGQAVDICTNGGMKSWSLANIDDNWWSYYDTNTQELVFTNEVESLAYNDVYKMFSSFLGYGNVRWNFRIKDKMCQVCPPGFTQVISSTSTTLTNSLRIVDTTKKHTDMTNTFWKKNSIEATKFFGNYSPIEIQLHCNPEPTLDKTFSTVEYRADCFDASSNYLANESFDTFRAWNEYQDTMETTLLFNDINRNYAVYSRSSVYRLKKKFRIWRIDIPRAYYVDTINLPGNTVEVPDITETTHVNPLINVNPGGRSRDRIRNPWCNIYLAFDTSKADKIIFNDLAIQYFK